MTPAVFGPIREVLDEAAQDGLTLDCWWRDDDAVRHTPELDRLLSLSRDMGRPLALATIPASLETSLVERVGEHAGLRVLVHGLGHVNHEGHREKAAEFGPARPLGPMEEDARRGLAMTRVAFPEQVLDVFVPPWNRVRPELAPRLPELGYRGISTFGPKAPARIDGLVTVNTHLDPVNWRDGRGLCDPAELAAALRRVIGAKPPGGPVEPIGVLTHHLMFDEDLWTFSSGLLAMLAGHPAVRFPPLEAIWGGQRSD